MKRPTHGHIRCRCCANWFVPDGKQTLCLACWTDYSGGAAEVTQPLTEVGERVQELQKLNEKLKRDIKEMNSQIKLMEKQ